MVKSKSKNKYTISFKYDDPFVLAFCAEFPEAYGQGKTEAKAIEDLAACVAFLLQCYWEEANGITHVKPKRKGRAA